MDLDMAYKAYLWRWLGKDLDDRIDSKPLSFEEWKRRVINDEQGTY